MRANMSVRSTTQPPPEPSAHARPKPGARTAAPADPESPAPQLPARIEDYALIGDCTTSALVSRGGSIDWLCWPRFDSAACFAALLGTSDHGRWLIAPARPARKIRRHYRDGSLVLETVFTTDSGEVAVVDFMPIGQRNSSIVRVVEGRHGHVDMEMSLALRFDYGLTVPWVRRLERSGGICAVAGPDQVVLRSPVPTEGRGLSTGASFRVTAGTSLAFSLTHAASHLHPPPPVDPSAVLRETELFWSRWSERGTYKGPYAAAVKRSLITLKALTYHPTGGIVAAPTTSLPEQLGGSRNWDYRYCWLRDATLTLLAFMENGYYNEAQAWRDWLHRSIAGSPSQTQIMYGLAGERRLDEWSVPWLPGYQGAAPVRIGNAAAGQLQLDVFGEVLNALHQARVGGLGSPPQSWELETALVEHLETIWEQPDEGIWETRGGRQHFTFSKAMAWVAVDRALRSAEAFHLPARREHWQALRQRMHDEICEKGFNKELNSFTQVFGGRELDASLLLLPIVDFLPADDPRIIGTVAAIESRLMRDGFVLRYDTDDSKDGLPPGEGAFLACSFWLAYAYARQGRAEDARHLFDRLLALCNDVGLLAEEYDPRAQRQTGNFPQAFSHIALIGTAFALQDNHGRGRRHGPGQKAGAAK
jgi:GH15 family glucan-1,4-alpha-glucosidase